MKESVYMVEHTLFIQLIPLECHLPKPCFTCAAHPNMSFIEIDMFILKT